jgi:hypothetical protein
MFLAGIRKRFLDTGLRRYDEREFGYLFLSRCTQDYRESVRRKHCRIQSSNQPHFAECNPLHRPEGGNERVAAHVSVSLDGMAIAPE